MKVLSERHTCLKVWAIIKFFSKRQDHFTFPQSVPLLATVTTILFIFIFFNHIGRNVVLLGSFYMFLNPAEHYFKDRNFETVKLCEIIS